MRARLADNKAITYVDTKYMLVSNKYLIYLFLFVIMSGAMQIQGTGFWQKSEIPGPQGVFPIYSVY